MFLVSSPSRIGDLPQSLGMADYSYSFLVKSLAPVLEGPHPVEAPLLH